MKDQEPALTADTPFQKRLRYLIDMLGVARPLRIADVGANPINVPDYTELQKMGGCEVWGFEPEPIAFAELMKDPLPGSHFVQRAVGKTGKGVFYSHPRSGLGSILPIDKAGVTYLGRPGWHGKQRDPIEIDLVALDKLPVKELPKPDLLKIDIQGGELDVFQTGRKKLSDAIAVVTEVRFSPIYEDEPLWGDLDAELRGQGFALHKLMFAKSVPAASSVQQQMFKPRLKNQLMDGDAVYIRDPLKMGQWSDEQIKQLAVAAAGVFDSLDLTFHCLDALIARGVLAETATQDFLKILPRWMQR
ncbi:FkbM family methyltransferase [Sulfitobacter sp. JB4-11]|uniref:FkbM family methyltransferase n=1 Tax=Sulfitobacter rhodophyticola TaxID=3238304 RepID=UPI003515F082